MIDEAPTQNTVLMCGEKVRVEAVGPSCAVPGLGRLVARTVVERRTGEHLQRLTETSDAHALVKQWDEQLGAAEAAARLR